MAPKITAPVEGFAGDVVGVQFKDGTAHVKASETGKVQYFQRHGYGVEETPSEKKAREKAEDEAIAAAAAAEAERLEAMKAAAETLEGQGS